MIPRRDFITLLGGAATAYVSWPMTTRAQVPERHIGVLMGLAEDDRDTKARLFALRQGLEKLGWVEGRNVRIDYRFAPGGARAEVFAKELVELRPDVILSNASPATAALQRETKVIPIVFTGVTDPIGSGFVAGLARPGGNITGFMLFESSITGKWLAMLKEVAPDLARAALVINPKSAPYVSNLFACCQAAAPSLGIEVKFVPFENTARSSAPSRWLSRPPNGGLARCSSRSNDASCHRPISIIALAARHRLPAVYSDRFRHSRRADVLRYRAARTVSDGGILRRSHPAGREACRSAGAGADQVRDRDQSEDRQDARPHRAAIGCSCSPTR